jgi:arylsulfatase A-like enzyme
VSSLDIAATVLDFAGLPIPTEMQGISQRAVFEGRARQTRESFLIDNRAVQKGFYQKMLVTDTHKLVAYMDQPYGELYDLAHDPHQYNNLWDSPRQQARKHQMLAELCAQSGADIQKLANASPEELLSIMNHQMRSEEPVQERTSFS